MYLLILLMTYVSAIYEYNLSARPDYDRDVARKKANAIFYKFDIQHAKALSVIGFVAGYVDEITNQHVDVTFPQPNTILAGSRARCTGHTKCNAEGQHETSLFFVQDGIDIPIMLRPECDECLACDGTSSKCGKDNDGDDVVDERHSSKAHGIDGSWYQKIMLTIEQSLYDESEMASKLLCLNKKLYEDDPEDCTPPRDTDNNLIGTCCYDSGVYRMLVSYKRVDPRWLNRINRGISMDFWRAIENRPFYTNIGIVQWDRSKRKWIFRGKTNNIASYYDKYVAWQEQEEAKEAADPSYIKKIIPRYLSNVTTWELPEDVFTENFFVGLDGSEMCKENGCIFRLNEL